MDIPQIENEYRVDSCVYFCYILKHFGELPESVIGAIILSAVQSSYFQVMSDVEFMRQKGLIDAKRDETTGETVYSLLTEGERIAEDLSSVLDDEIKQQTLTVGREILSQKDRERSVRCDITRDRSRNRYDLNIRFLNELTGETLFEMKLYAPDEAKAKEMRDRFLTKPSFYITHIINLFLKDYPFFI